MKREMEIIVLQSSGYSRSSRHLPTPVDNTVGGPEGHNVCDTGSGVL